MDYGPFGFMEEYEALWNPFTSDQDKKFGFERQPTAAHINLVTLARALSPLLNGDEVHMEALQHVISHEYPEALEKELGEVRRKKLGLSKWSRDLEESLWHRLQAEVLPGMNYNIFCPTLSLSLTLGPPRDGL